MAGIRIGTSSFTATGWQGSFYPKGLRPADYLSYYAQQFDIVEIDSTFYATPNVSVVRSWNAKTPEGFLFAAKVPQEITHKRVLKDCDEEFKVFLTTMEALGKKLGPLLFQFGKFDKYAFKSLDDFLARLHAPELQRDGLPHSKSSWYTWLSSQAATWCDGRVSSMKTSLGFRSCTSCNAGRRATLGGIGSGGEPSFIEILIAVLASVESENPCSWRTISQT